LRYLILSFLLFSFLNAFAATGQWPSKVTGKNINYIVTNAKEPLVDNAGRYATVVYLEDLNIKKIGRNSNKKDVAWLLAQGFRVIELKYDHDAQAAPVKINADIIAINDSIAAGSFCGVKDCSHYRSYVLFEGYRIKCNVSYFKDDPAVYNTPTEYTVGDSLKMDIVYPANASRKVPVILSFSYSNSYAIYNASQQKLTNENKDQRLKLEYTLAGFNDSFLEAAPANGIAWAIADHPKYCPWGKGKPVNGREDTYKSFQEGTDAARKVRSAVRTLRKLGADMGLSGRIGIFGFSRGSTAGSLTVGDKGEPDIDNAGFFSGVSSRVQAAALGPGVFNYTRIYDTLNDGDINLETRCVWAWGELDQNRAKWEKQGAAYYVRSKATAPVMFFYNTDDDHYYQGQITNFRAKLDSLHVPNSTLLNYGKGHAIPQTEASLVQLYNFFSKYLKSPHIHY
jgi:dienelactone hydrolase